MINHITQQSAFKKIYIVGAGAIGMALAVLLKKENRDVVLVRASRDESVVYSRTIQLLLRDQRVVEAMVDVQSLSGLQHPEALIVLTSKSYGNGRLASVLKDNLKTAPVVILQNGIGVEEPFIQQGLTDVYRCVLFVTSQFNDAGQIVFKPVAPCPVGTIVGDEQVLQQVVAALNTPLFSFVAERDIQTVIWKKAIANCVFNSVCPLLDVDNGIFHRSEAALAIATNLINECVAIANATGISLTTPVILESLMAISKASDGQFISTLQDIRKGRPTEIKSLNAEIARIADLLGKSEMVKRTRLLGELIALKSTLHLAS